MASEDPSAKSCFWCPLQVEMVAGQERTTLLAGVPMIFQKSPACVIFQCLGQFSCFSVYGGHLGSFKVTFHSPFRVFFPPLYTDGFTFVFKDHTSIFLLLFCLLTLCRLNTPTKL
jgi:hypothetical protein